MVPADQLLRARYDRVPRVWGIQSFPINETLLRDSARGKAVFLSVRSVVQFLRRSVSFLFLSCVTGAKVSPTTNHFEFPRRSTATRESAGSGAFRRVPGPHFPLGGMMGVAVKVDSSLFEDKRFSKLTLLVGDRERALGVLVVAWLAGKREWNKSGLGVPLEHWRKLEAHNEILQVGLASIEPGERVLLKGAKEKFGKQGGKQSEKAIAPASPTAKTWTAYAEAYEKRYRKPPVRNAMVNGQLRSLVSRVGGEAAPQVATFYLKHNDSFYVRNLHPVGLLLKDAEKLHTEWKMNSTMTGTKARQVENTSSNVDVFSKILGEAEQRS